MLYTHIFVLYLFSLFSQETTVTATIYHAVAEQTDFNTRHNCSMFKLDLNNPRKHNIIAVSRDLEALGFKLGTKVIVTGAGDLDGVWNIEDRMNKRFTKRIDFLVNTSLKGGKWENVKIKTIK